MQTAKQNGNFKAIPSIIRQLVETTKGFHGLVQRQTQKSYFDQVLSQVLELLQSPGAPAIAGLQDEIVKYIDRMITIMGLDAKPLVSQMVPYFLQ